MPVAVEFLPVGDSDGDAILIQYGDSTGYRLNLDRVAGSAGASASGTIGRRPPVNQTT
jgi:hypothetical protein